MIACYQRSEDLNMWLGETERMVREIFAIAREKAKEGYLVFIFIDAARRPLRTRRLRALAEHLHNTVVPQFCAEMDGLVMPRKMWWCC